MWNAYLNTVEGARDQFRLLSPSKCRGWDVEHRNRLNSALVEIDRYLHDMLEALSEGGR
jgi:hypothetical protein